MERDATLGLVRARPESALHRLSARVVPFAGLLVLSVALALSTDRFLSLSNLLDVARRVSVINIIALGMTFVIITGGIDLSVGSASALARVAGTWSLTQGAPIGVAELLGDGHREPAGLLNPMIVGWILTQHHQATVST